MLGSVAPGLTNKIFIFNYLYIFCCFECTLAQHGWVANNGFKNHVLVHHGQNPPNVIGVVCSLAVGELPAPVPPAEDLAHPLVPLRVLQPPQGPGQHHRALPLPAPVSGRLVLYLRSPHVGPMAAVVMAAQAYVDEIQ